MKNMLWAWASWAAMSATCCSPASISSICPGIACSPAMIRRPSAGERSCMRPRFRPSRANATAVAVNVSVALPGDGAADRVHHAEYAAPLALQLLDGGQRVVGLAGLADPHVQGVRLHDGVAVTELRGGLGRGRDAGQVLDELRANLARVVGRAAAEHQDPADL